MLRYPDERAKLPWLICRLSLLIPPFRSLGLILTNSFPYVELPGREEGSETVENPHWSVQTVRTPERRDILGVLRNFRDP
eukprot:1393612-Amorphochlora_amoeboformis.AAC.1